jgi:ATP-dependent Clp protease adaptor protein ClpS
MNRDMEYPMMSTKWQEQEVFDTDVLTEQLHHIIVWNDEVNTFDWVIQSLVEVCDHSETQAEQCALFIHFKGKYAVKQGDFNTLRPQCEALIDRGLSATID